MTDKPAVFTVRPTAPPPGRFLAWVLKRLLKNRTYIANVHLHMDTKQASDDEPTWVHIEYAHTLQCNITFAPIGGSIPETKNDWLNDVRG